MMQSVENSCRGVKMLITLIASPQMCLCVYCNKDVLCITTNWGLKPLGCCIWNESKRCRFSVEYSLCELPELSTNKGLPDNCIKLIKCVLQHRVEVCSHDRFRCRMY